MADRGSFWCDDGKRRFLWKRCEVEGCEHGICVRLSPIYCWPHYMMGGAPDPSLADEDVTEGAKADG